MCSVCVCVLEILVLKFFLDWETILRVFCVDWIIGWVICWLAFISMFFTSRKTVSKSWLNTSLTPPRYLAICWASQAFFFMQSRHLLDTWWIGRESSCLLDSSSTLGESIELLFLNSILCFSIPSRYLSCRRPIPRHLPRQLPRYLPIPQLSSITEGSIYSSITILLSFLRSLSICPRLFISQTLSFSLQTSSSRFLQAFSSFSTLGKCLIPLYSCISCFKT